MSPASASTSGSWFRAMPHTGATLNLGRTLGGTNYFQGTLDDLRIYDRTLSDAEVKVLHDLGQ